MQRISKGLLKVSAALTFLSVALLAPSPVRGQSAADDLYGVPGTPSKPAAPSTPSASTASTAPSASSSPSVPAPDTAKSAAATPSKADTGTAPPVMTPRSRVTRETTINPINEKKGAYRSPKKALFMSLVVPGLGQAYVGQSKFTYARAGLYFGTEILLGTMWYHYTVVKYDRQVKNYRRYADNHFSMSRYETEVFASPTAVNGVEDDFRSINPYRSSYCDAVQEKESTPGNNLNKICEEIYDPVTRASHSDYAGQYEDGFSTADSATLRGAMRAGFADVDEFYALIGRYQEFIAGWDDAANVFYTDTSITGTSANRETYNTMRQKAQDYSRMQAWFIGGLVLNHIASAVDAALTARRNNKQLYENEARWYDRVHMDGGLAFETGRPRTYMTARLSF